MFCNSMVEERKGPSRKKHKNSRLGCATCKRRRVKCAENLPACTNCLKHGVRCEYLDYNEEQLEDFHKAKLARLKDRDKLGEKKKGERHSGGLESLRRKKAPPVEVKKEKEKELGSSSSREALVEAEETDRAGLASLRIDDGDQLSRRKPLPLTFHDDLLMALDSDMMPLELQTFLHQHLSDNVFFEVSQDGPNASSLPGGVLDVLNFQHNAITQNFDNLLSTGDATQIIYPVYSIHNSSSVTPGNFEWDSEYAGSGADHVSYLQAQRSQGPTGPFAAARDVFRSPEVVRRSISQISSDAKPTPVSAPPPGPALPGARIVPSRFKIPARKTTNYEQLLYQTTGALAPRISKGIATLPEIRSLYHVWIGYFIYKAFKSSVMFLCLINLTTNYLITNVFSAELDTRFDALVLLTKTRNMLLVHLIQHYATVIKGLRSLLNHHGDPEMAASVSYILSLMSIYDPGATAHSTTCFRDGMFLVLSYTLHQASRQGVEPPRLIPIHLQLMTNVARTVYLPGYGTLFLYEFESMFARFGAVLERAERALDGKQENLIFLRRKYNDLLLFSKDSIRHHLPALDSHMDDIEYQEDVLFTMFNRWSKLQPPRFLAANSCAEGLEKVLNLFYRVFRKAIFAVVPQVRFLFLRDFDSPLMLDVFANYNTTTILEELKDPSTASVPPKVYRELVPELQYLASYCVRLITFLTLRTAILYRNLVYEEKVRQLIPIYNVVEWRKSITNIEVTRQDFHELIGLLEYPISSFKDTYITRSHYPQIVDPLSPGAKLATPRPPENDGADGEVDMLSLQPNGLLKHDMFPEL